MHTAMKRFVPRKLIALVTAGALAASMLPATALAQTVTAAEVSTAALQAASAAGVTVGNGGNSQPTDKTLATTANDPTGETAMWADGAWVKDPSTVTDGVYQWKTTIKGDGSHYGHYDVLLTFTVKNKVLTAVDLTSLGTTFGGKWGTITPKSTNITGYLPQGVAVTAVQDAASGPIALKLSGDEQYGGSTITAITLCAVEDDGSLKTEIQEVVDPDDGDVDLKEVVVGYDVASSLQASTAAASSSRARPGSGSSASLATSDSVDTSVVNWNHATQSFTLADDARSEYNLAKVTYRIGDYFVFDQYIALDGNGGKGATYRVIPTNMDVDPSGIGAKNRDVYTAAAFVLMMQRQLVSWQESVGNGTKVDLDTVSAATKSSDSLKESFYALDGYVFPSSNHTDPMDYLDVAAWGKLFSSVSDQLQITLDKGKVGGSTLWDQSSVSVNAAGDYVLSYKLSEDLPVSSLSFYSSPSKLNIEEMWSLGKTEPVAQFVTTNTAEHGICGALGDDEVVSDQVSWNSASKTITIKKNSGINYVAIGLGVGKLASNGICDVPYSLEEMAAAATVSSQINAATTTAAMTAAQSAYGALTPDARTFVTRAAVAKMNTPITAAPAPVVQQKTVQQKLTLSNLAQSYGASYIKSGKLKSARAFTLKASGAKGKVTYTASMGSTAKRYISLTSAGKVTVKRNTPVGTYSFKVKASAAKLVSGTTTYPATSVTKTVTVTVGAQTVKLASSSKTLKATALKKAASTFTVTAKTSAGKLTSAKNVSTTAAAKKFTVKKSGTNKVSIKVPRGTKKGTYTIKVQLKSPKVSKKYVAATATCTFKVKVK